MTTRADTPHLEPQPEQPAPAQPQGIQAQRAMLRAAGLKRCPSHDRYRDRLPEAAWQPVAGQTDPAIRPLSEFGHEASCKACVKLRMSDHRAARPDSQGPQPSPLARKLIRLRRRHAALTTEIDTLIAQLPADDLAYVEARNGVLDDPSSPKADPA